MEKWVFILLCCLAVILVVLCILQIIWIRTKLSSVMESALDKEGKVKRQALDSINSANTLNMYSLVCDVGLTIKINKTSNNFYSKIQQQLKPQRFSIPHVCSTSYASLEVDANNVALIAVKRGNGSSSLLFDITNNRIRYIQMNGVLFLVWYDEKVMASMKDTFYNYGMTEVESCEVFAIYAIDSADNFKYLPPGDTDCRVQLKPFNGILSNRTHFQPSASSKDTLMIDAVFGTKSSGLLPMHVLGYKIS